jgi:hypothetical protein
MTASAATDLHLATAHHLLFLLLAGVLAFEIGAVRSSMDREDILRVARGRCLVWPLSRSHYSGRIFAGHLRGQRLGLLLRQPVLLGETWCLRRGGPVINHAHGRVHSLAKGDIGQSHLLTGSARNPQCQALSLRGSDTLRPHSCVRRRHGPGLRLAIALVRILAVASWQLSGYTGRDANDGLSPNGRGASLP